MRCGMDKFLRNFLTNKYKDGCQESTESIIKSARHTKSEVLFP